MAGPDADLQAYLNEKFNRAYDRIEDDADAAEQIFISLLEHPRPFMEAYAVQCDPRGHLGQH
jgi:hypothetical protein